MRPIVSTPGGRVAGFGGKEAVPAYLLDRGDTSQVGENESARSWDPGGCPGGGCGSGGGGNRGGGGGEYRPPGACERGVHIWAPPSGACVELPGCASNDASGCCGLAPSGDDSSSHGALLVDYSDSESSVTGGGS